MGGKSLRKCEICGVRRVTKTTSDIFLARFPLEPDRCRLWVKATGNEDLAYIPLYKLNENKFICGRHFPHNMYNNNGNRLKKIAVPTLDLINPPLSDEILANFPICETYNLAPRKRKTDTLLDYTSNCKGQPILQTEKKYERVTKIQSAKQRKINTILDCPSTSKAGLSPQINEIHESASNIQRVKKHEIDTEMSPRKKKIRKKSQDTQHLLEDLSTSSDNFDNLNSDFFNNIESQAVKNQARNPHGKRWDMKTKISCLQILKRSPKTYRYLQHNFQMPSVRTIKRLLQNLNMEPGINMDLLNQLQEKATTMPSESKLCTVIFDEISLKKTLIFNEHTDKVEGYVDYGPEEGRGRQNLLADKALVFMIQGIHRKYKQPLAYYFVKAPISSQNLASLINDIIKAIESTSFTVIATVCSQRPTNCGALSQLKKNSNIPQDANYFLVRSSKIYIIFDVPHLFKSIRNNFFEAGTMGMNGKVGKWQHLRDAERINQDKLYFHKITPLLLNPKQKMKMKVKYAAQTLSNTFAAILKMIAEKHAGTQYGQEVDQTSDIVRDLNKLFDFTNGPAHPTDVIKGQRENVSQKTNHLEVWNDFLKKIPTIKFLKSDSRIQLRKVRCVQGFIITIKSLKDIWFDCQKRGFKNLNLRQLNQDSLENLFGVVRQTSPTNKNPTCAHFNSALKTILISGLKVPHSRGANCENDMNKLLFTTSLKPSVRGDTTILSGSCSDVREETENTEEYPTIMLAETEFEEQIENDLCHIENQPIMYLCGYLAYKLLKGNDCQTCSNLLQVNDAIDDPIYKYLSLREWWKDKRSLTYPSIPLCQTTEAGVICFKSNLHIFHEDNVGKKMFTIMSVKINFAWWSCDRHRYMTESICRLITKILIRRQCQVYNEEFIETEVSASAI